MPKFRPIGSPLNNLVEFAKDINFTLKALFKQYYSTLVYISKGDKKTCNIIAIDIRIFAIRKAMLI